MRYNKMLKGLEEDPYFLDNIPKLRTRYSDEVIERHIIIGLVKIRNEAFYYPTWDEFDRLTDLIGLVKKGVKDYEETVSRERQPLKAAAGF